MSNRVRRSVALSQNFLVNHALVRQLVASSSLAAGDLVYEIGPGGGIITNELARLGCRVVAVERDPRLARRLALACAQVPNVGIHLADFLEFPLPAWPYKVFANPPFTISADLIRRLFSDVEGPDDAYLVVQRELADRICGRPRETLFGLLIRPWYELAIVYHFRRSDFRPAPSVEVVLLRLHKRGPPLVAPELTSPYKELLASIFHRPERTLRTALTGVIGPRGLDRLGVEINRPRSEVPLEVWLRVLEERVRR